MAKTRRKAEVLPAVQSRGAAIEALTRYAELAGEIAARDARVVAVIAKLRAESDALNAPLVTEQEALFMAIKPWWAVAGSTVTEGDRKTAELGGCLLGHRIGNPTLKSPPPEPTAVRLLVERGWQGLLRIKFELDKPAIMAALRWLSIPRAAVDAPPEGDDDAAEIEGALAWFKSAGFKIVQKEEFFIDRLPPKGDSVDVVTDPQSLQVAA